MTTDRALLIRTARRVLAEHAGVAHLQRFVDAGLSGTQVAHLKHLGVLLRPRIGWYADPVVPAAGIRAVRVGGVLGCTSAAASWGIVVPEGVDRRLEVSLVPGTTRLRRADDATRRAWAADRAGRAVALGPPRRSGDGMARVTARRDPAAGRMRRVALAGRRDRLGALRGAAPADPVGGRGRPTPRAAARAPPLRRGPQRPAVGDVRRDDGAARRGGRRDPVRPEPAGDGGLPVRRPGRRLAPGRDRRHARRIRAPRRWSAIASETRPSRSSARLPSASRRTRRSARPPGSSRPSAASGFADPQKQPDTPLGDPLHPACRPGTADRRRKCGSARSQPA